MNNKTILFLAIYLIICGCNKGPETPHLPPATHTGANILACKVNGQVYIATGHGGGWYNGVIWYVYSDSAVVTALGVASSYNTMGTPSFTMSMGSRFRGLGTYPIVKTTISPGGGVYDTYYNSINTTTGGSITYTYYDGYVLAGTFVFDASDSSGHVVHITEGRFDITHL